MRLTISTPAVKRAARGAFTLAELLVVIGIIGLVAAIGLPSLKAFNQSGGMTGAYRQLLDDFNRARQLAVLNRSTVLMVFIPPDLAGYINAGSPGLTQTREQNRVKELLEGQFTAYALVSLRTVGDQPGRSYPRYLSDWRFLPEGTLIPVNKFIAGRGLNIPNYGAVLPFDYTAQIPFPFIESPKFNWKNFGDGRMEGLPYIGFNAQGQLISEGEAVVPLALGGVFVPRVNGVPLIEVAEVRENPAGNSTNSYNLISVNRLTGRARYLKPELQ